MLLEDQCKEYANTDRSPMREFFVNQLINTITLHGTIADLGCGPGDYGIHISKIFPDVIIDAYDGSAAMVSLAKKAASNFPNVRVFQVPVDAIDKKYDVIISANTLHHFSDPAVFWKAIKSLSSSSTRVFIMDILRPDSVSKLESIIATSTIKFNDLFRKDFKDSLHAAFTQEEIKEQILSQGLTLSTTTYTIDRELDIIIIYGSPL
jgi:trans-aconitate methyltransferase